MPTFQLLFENPYRNLDRMNTINRMKKGEAGAAPFCSAIL